MLHVVLDANAVGVDPPLGKLEHRVLLDAHRAERIVLVVPTLALREAVSAWKREIRQQSSKLIALRQRMEQLHPEYSLHVPPLDRDAAAEQLLSDRLATLEAAHVRIPETPHLSHEDLISRALDRRQPFDANGCGYRDALLWALVCDIAAEGHDVALVSNDPRAFAEGRKEGAPLAAALIAQLGDRSGQLFASAHAANRELNLVAPEALKAARAVVDRGRRELAEMLRTRLVEELSHSVTRWTARELVNPFLSKGVALGLAHDGLDVDVLEARRTDHDRLELTAALEVRQFVTIFVPVALWQNVSHLGRPFVSDDEVAGVEIDARVRHLCRVVLDPIDDRILEAEALEVIDASTEDVTWLTDTQQA